jgi:hypothetical protein
VPKQRFTPYANEADTLQIGELTIENRLDRISIYGSIDLTLDKEGKRMALDLKNIIELAVAKLEETALPDKISIRETETVKNPFA